MPRDWQMIPYNGPPQNAFSFRNAGRSLGAVLSRGSNAVGYLTSRAYNTPILGIVDRLYRQGRLAYNVYNQLQAGYQAVADKYDKYKEVAKKVEKRTRPFRQKKIKDFFRGKFGRPTLGFGSRRMNRLMYLNRGRGISRRIRKSRRRW